jgi:hypothetical protein
LEETDSLFLAGSFSARLTSRGAVFKTAGHMSRPRSICVFCSSSNAVAPRFFAVAEEVGALLARRGLTLVYGGGNVGLMGALAQSAKKHGGRVIGVIPRFMVDKELAYAESDELLVVATMRERKERMESCADAFVALPGGWGTLEEVLEILTLKQLQQHTKPVVFLNIDGFYDPLLRMFDQLVELRFKRPEHKQLYHVAGEPADIFACLDGYEAPKLPEKWV